MDCHKRTLENIPLKQEALLRSSRRALHQAGYICKRVLKCSKVYNGAGSAEWFAYVRAVHCCNTATLQSIMSKKHNLKRGIANVLMLI